MRFTLLFLFSLSIFLVLSTVSAGRPLARVSVLVRTDRENSQAQTLPIDQLSSGQLNEAESEVEEFQSENENENESEAEVDDAQSSKDEESNRKLMKESEEDRKLLKDAEEIYKRGLTKNNIPYAELCIDTKNMLFGGCITSANCRKLKGTRIPNGVDGTEFCDRFNKPKTKQNEKLICCSKMHF